MVSGALLRIYAFSDKKNIKTKVSWNNAETSDSDKRYIRVMSIVSIEGAAIIRKWNPKIRFKICDELKTCHCLPHLRRRCFGQILPRIVIEYVRQFWTIKKFQEVPTFRIMLEEVSLQKTFLIHVREQKKILSTCHIAKLSKHLKVTSFFEKGMLRSGMNY